jgi:hypothetical protein
MTRDTEALLVEVLIELLRFLKRKDEEHQRGELEERLAEIRNRQWGYPVPRQRKR